MSEFNSFQKQNDVVFDMSAPTPLERFINTAYSKRGKAGLGILLNPCNVQNHPVGAERLMWESLPTFAFLDDLGKLFKKWALCFQNAQDPLTVATSPEYCDELFAILQKHGFLFRI